MAASAQPSAAASSRSGNYDAGKLSKDQIAQLLLPLLGSKAETNTLKVQVIPYPDYKRGKNGKKLPKAVKIKSINSLRTVQNAPLEDDEPLAVILADPKYLNKSIEISDDSNNESIEHVDIVDKRKLPRNVFRYSDVHKSSEDSSSDESSNENENRDGGTLESNSKELENRHKYVGIRSNDQEITLHSKNEVHRNESYSNESESSEDDYNRSHNNKISHKNLDGHFSDISKEAKENILKQSLKQNNIKIVKLLDSDQESSIQKDSDQSILNKNNDDDIFSKLNSSGENLLRLKHDQIYDFHLFPNINEKKIDDPLNDLNDVNKHNNVNNNKKKEPISIRKNRNYPDIKHHKQSKNSSEDLKSSEDLRIQRISNDHRHIHVNKFDDNAKSLNLNSLNDPKSEVLLLKKHDPYIDKVEIEEHYPLSENIAAGVEYSDESEQHTASKKTIRTYDDEINFGHDKSIIQYYENIGNSKSEDDSISESSPSKEESAQKNSKNNLKKVLSQLANFPFVNETSKEISNIGKDELKVSEENIELISKKLDDVLRDGKTNNVEKIYLNILNSSAQDTTTKNIIDQSDMNDNLELKQIRTSDDVSRAEAPSQKIAKLSKTHDSASLRHVEDESLNNQDGKDIVDAITSIVSKSKNFGNKEDGHDSKSYNLAFLFNWQ